METAVQAAWITGGAAMIVALAGICGSILGQYLVAKKGHEDALALFQKQADEQAAVRKQEEVERARIRAEEAEERRRATFVVQRQEAYVELLSALSRRGEGAPGPTRPRPSPSKSRHV